MKKSDLTKTEWSIMNICWAQGEVTARTIYDESLKEKKRGYQTVKTMLDRLAGKGFLSRKKFGPLWLYKPAVSRAKVMGGAIDSFVSTVLDNTFTPLLMHFADKEKLSPKEIKALKKLFKENKKEK